MTIEHQRLLCHPEDTVVLSGTVTSGGVAKNLSGASILFRLFDHSGTILTKQTGGQGIVVTNAASGLYEVSIDPDDTEGLGGKTYEFEVIVTDGSGNVATVATGTLFIYKE